MTTENERKKLEAKAKSLRETAAALEMDGDDSWREYAEDASLFELAARALTAPAGVEVEGLVGKWRELTENLVRADMNTAAAATRHCADELATALAKPGEDFEAKVGAVGDACDTLLHKMEGWDKAYPEDIFPELTAEERDWMQANKRGFIDRISASMGRHIARCIREDLAGIRAALDAAGVK